MAVSGCPPKTGMAKAPLTSKLDRHEGLRKSRWTEKSMRGSQIAVSTCGHPCQAVMYPEQAKITPAPTAPDMEPPMARTNSAMLVPTINVFTAKRSPHAAGVGKM